MKFTWLFLMNEIWKKKNMLCQPKKNLLWLFNTVIPRNHDIFGDYLGFAKTVFSSLRSSLLLVHIFLPDLFLPVNFAFNMLWYSTLWTATSFSNDALWLTLFVEVSMIVFWTVAKSAVFPIIVLSKNKRYPECILYGFIEINCHLLKLKCKYSNILRYWIFDFHEL